jgi:hypothetical protein
MGNIENKRKIQANPKEKAMAKEKDTRIGGKHIGRKS